MQKIVCSRCVMDNEGDPTITFFKDGTCNYCNYALNRKDKVYFPGESGRLKLESLLKKIKEEGKDKRYDCLMGLSGGLDSSYLAYLGSKWGLRILAVHVDDGFDTDAAKENISRLYSECNNLELVIEKPDSMMLNDLVKAFILAGVPNIAIPQDNILLATIYHFAIKYKLKYFLSGANFALESILQRGNTHNACDSIHIKAIHKRYGEATLNYAESYYVV
jgi:hypothetical protein